MGQYHNDKYLWEKENDYEYINFKIMDSIKSTEKEIQKYSNKKIYRIKNIKEINNIKEANQCIHQTIYYIIL